MAQVVRRLSALEYLILAGILILALAGGALLALLLQTGLGLPFRITWIVGSILFFTVPGALVLTRERARSSRNRRDDTPEAKERNG